MALKIPDAGERFILDKIRSSYNTSPGLQLCLYRNDYVPVDATVIGNITEANYSGYARQNVADWGAPSTVGARAFMAAGPRTFAVQAGGTGNSIYGYFVLDQFGNLLWLERDPNVPVPMNVIGDSYQITPTFTFVTEF